MLSKAIYYTLSNDAAVTAITSDIYAVIAPQGTPNPCIVFSISVEPEDDKDGVSSLDIARLQVDIYCDRGRFSQMQDLYTAVRAALDRTSGVIEGLTIDNIAYDGHDELFDDVSDAYRYSIDFIIRHKR